jgi:cell division septation protein DedD
MAASNYDDTDRFGPGTAYAEPSPGMSNFVKILIGTVGLLVVVAFGWVVWIAYDEGVRTGAVKTVPVIHADAGEIKRKPAEPGGLVVPDQDKLVFNRLAPGQADEPIERLLPPPEVPLALPVMQNSTPPVKSVSPTSEPPDTEIATALTPKLVEPAPVKRAPPVQTVDPAEIIANAPPSSGVPLNLQSDLPVQTPAPSPAPVETLQLPAKVAAKAPPPSPAPAPAVDKSPEIVLSAAWRIQLVSLSSQKDAEAVWGRMQKANKDLLGGLALQVQAVKLSKGTFYRVQAGPLANRAAADSLCGTLKSRKQDCLVVAPK